MSHHAARCPNRTQSGESKRKFRKDELEQKQKGKLVNKVKDKYLRRGERDESKEEDSEELHMIKEQKEDNMTEDDE